MKTFNNEKKHEYGISITAILTVFSILAIILLAAVTHFTVNIPIISRRMEEFNRELRVCELDSVDVERGKAFLTRQARLYIENRDTVYLDNYFEELNDTRRVENALTSLESSSVLYGKQESVAKIKSYVKQMCDMEIYAISLIATVSGASGSGLPQEITDTPISAEDAALSDDNKIAKAHKYVFGDGYQLIHTNFENEIDVFKRAMTDSLETKLAAVTHELSSATAHQRTFIIILVLLLLGMFTAFAFFFILPVKSFISSINENRPLRSIGTSELKRLSQSYNNLYVKNAAEKSALVASAENDALTGLLNQRAFISLKKEFSDNKSRIALMIIDVDHFKEINDDYGHAIGDRMLKHVANELLKVVDANDRVMRFGGDEFAVITLNISSPRIETENIRRKINALNEALSEPQPDLPALSVSVGAAFSETGYSDDLFNQADAAMYSIKRNGGGGVCFYDGTENLCLVGDNSNPADDKPKILLVDDSEFNRSFLEEILGETYSFVHVENGFGAISALENEGATFSLILLDLVMPECDGFGLLDYMQKYHWTEILPVIVISAENDVEQVERAFNMGITDYINRPFTPNIVRKKVDNTVSLYIKQKHLAGVAYNQIQKQVDSCDRMIHVLSHMVEFRNEASAAHLKRMDIITELLLDRLMQKPSPYALTLSQARMIRRAAPLHDIGNIAVPGDILSKPGPLTKEEYEIVKTHAVKGSEIIARIENYQNDKFLSIVYEICRYHHERYDGNGYPDRLKGDDIPVSAQVVGLADAYDALTGERCFKKPYPHEKAIEMIFNGECGVFNPLLLECLSEIADGLPDALNVTSSALNSRHKKEYFAEELSSKGDVAYSDKLLSNLHFETVRTNFLLKKTVSDKTFFYRADEGELTLSPECAELLGVSDCVIVHPELLINSGKTNFDMASWRELKECMTPENPETVITVTVRQDGVDIPYRCTVRSVFSIGKHSVFLGLVGALLQI